MNPQNFKNLMKYTIATAFVEPSEKGAYYCPANVLLIAPAECGKTRILKGIWAKKVLETMDLSSKLIAEKLVPQLESDEIRYIVIPDLIQLLGHKKTTAGSTIGFLNAVIEEGVKDNTFYGLEFHLKNTVNCGLLTAITTAEFYGNLRKWNAIGFLHRFLPVSYNYSEKTLREIHNEIASGKLFREVEDLSAKLPHKNKRVKVSIPKDFADDIQLLVYRIVERFNKMYYMYGNRKVFLDIKGFRLHDRLRQLARAICYIEGKGKRREVNSTDIKILYELEGLFNLPNSELVI